jgi:hypothetical protein
MIAVLFQRVLSCTSYQGMNIDASIHISGSVRFGWSIGCRARHCPRFPVRGPIAGDRGGYPQPVSGRSAGDPQRKILEIAIKPAEQIPEIYRYDRTLRCGFLKQKQPSPLIFVIADTGGDTRAAPTRYCKKYLTRRACTSSSCPPQPTPTSSRQRPPHQPLVTPTMTQRISTKSWKPPTRW